MKLYGKYRIEKADGSPLDPEAKYFVLRYDHKSKDKDARGVLRTYALRTQFKELWEDVVHEIFLATGKRVGIIKAMRMPENEKDL